MQTGSLNNPRCIPQPEIQKGICVVVLPQVPCLNCHMNRDRIPAALVIKIAGGCAVIVKIHCIRSSCWSEKDQQAQEKEQLAQGLWFEISDRRAGSGHREVASRNVDFAEIPFGIRMNA
jgi:hypothetical protein